MYSVLKEFCRKFGQSFSPPVPSRGNARNNWYISGIWSEYTEQWLQKHYQVQFERPVGRRRLDAALWRKKSNREGPIDIAIEWEWDNNKVDKDFCFGDFRKLFEVGAKCGIALVQTRIDGRRGTAQRERVLGNLAKCLRKYRKSDESVIIIEVRRVFHGRSNVEFLCVEHDLQGASEKRIANWVFTAEA